MKNLLINLLLAVTLLIATPLTSAEVIPIWNKTIEEGSIQDMQLLKGGDEFLLFTGFWDKGQLQVRNTTDGELIRSQPINADHNGKIIITPDSNRVIVLNGLQCELRNLDDTFSIVNSFNLEVIYTNIAIDPIRPYVYVTGVKMLCYNYETGELITEFKDYISDIDPRIAVSSDGKYLATLNNGKAYLKVWDLETMELIRNVQLWDDKLPEDEYWCESKDIQFSKLNSDVIFYSGVFPLSGVPDTIPSPRTGLRKFTISSNLNTDNIKKKPFSGKFIIINNEERCLIYASRELYFYSFFDKIEEMYYKPPNIYPGGKVVYNKKHDYFIGFESPYFCKFLYNRETFVQPNYTEEITIFPNPTGSFIKINLNCPEPQISYQINNTQGLLIFQNIVPNQGSNLQIDFSPYPTGVYFLTLNCNNRPKTYKIIKEG